MTAPIVNTNALSIAGGEITSTINGVASAPVTLPVADGTETVINDGTNTIVAGDGSAATPYTIAVPDNLDNSVSNEIQTLSIIGNDLSISGTGGNTVTLPADDDITGVSFDGTNLTVDEGATTSFSADLSGLRDSDWFQANSTAPATDINQDIYTLGNVGIGTTSPNAQVDIESSGVPLRIQPSAVTPTGSIAGQMFVGNDGILYIYDGTRSKWLSMDRTMVGWGRNSGNTSNEYLRQFNGALSNHQWLAYDT